jgi:hypothetical protein
MSAAAVHWQAALVVIVVVYVPPRTGTACVVGDSRYEHDAVGAVTDELWPQPVAAPSRTAPMMYRIFIATSLENLS